MTKRLLVNDNGLPFELRELQTLREQLDGLNDSARKDFRDQNASAIARHGAAKFLVVSGPGTGKSHLFLDRISYWCEKNAGARVLVTSFVRKLVADLQNDINETVTDDQKSRIAALTLHKLARSIVEKNHGTKKWPFKPYFRIIGQSWKQIVWEDVLGFSPAINSDVHSWNQFEQQLHQHEITQTEEWRALHQTYCKLCQFYNAAGFADLILRASSALRENSDLSDSDHLIVDEYQDFNRAEEALINLLAVNSKGLLVVGDDEQVLYQELKASSPTLIRKLYGDRNFVNGMLPFCGRSGYHITKSADHFIRKNQDNACIEKIYLPLRTDTQAARVQIIACATPATAVDYIESFVAQYEEKIEERKKQLDAGKEKDTFLLILTPAREINFYGAVKDRIKNIALKYRPQPRFFSEDYYRLLSYYSLASNPRNNFTFRKTLHSERVSFKRVHELLVAAMHDARDFCDLVEPEVTAVLEKCGEIKTLLDSDDSSMKKLEGISRLIPIGDSGKLQNELEAEAINDDGVQRLEHEEEEEAEMEEIEEKRMGAIELMTIVGSKGLSADHVIVIGFDDVNMSWVTKSAFYVAITRARESLHILTALKSGGARRSHEFLDLLPSDHAEFYSYRKADHSKNKLRNREDFKRYLESLNFRSRAKTNSDKTTA